MIEKRRVSKQRAMARLALVHVNEYTNDRRVRLSEQSVTTECHGFADR